MSYERHGPAGDRSRAEAGTGGAGSAGAHRVLAELQQKLDSMPVIEQAKGMLMARFSVDPDRAFGLLVRWSQHNNLKLRSLCEALVATAGDAAALDGVIATLQERGSGQAGAKPGPGNELAP